MIVCGIDPGKYGGIVVLDGAGVLEKHVTPLVGKEYDMLGMHHILRNLPKNLRTEAFVFIEAAHAFPLARGGSHAMFESGYGYGLWSGLLFESGVLAYAVSCQLWQGVYFADRRRVSTPKQASVSFATRTWPLEKWTVGSSKKPHDGLTDAACIAEFGRQWLSMPGDVRATVESGMKRIR